jgi:hypothetical protein
MKNKLKVEGEPKEVTEIRNKILNTFNELVFVEEGHKYYLRGEELTSVSHITHQFAQPFDEDKIATNYALKHGETKEYWLDKWRYNSLKATTTGTLVHEFGESMAWLRNGHPELITESCKTKFIADKNWLVPTRTKEESVIKFWDDLPSSFHFVLAETKVYSGVNPEVEKLNQNYAGTFDLLFYYKDENDDSKSGLVIFDYKTNADLRKDFSRAYNKMLLPPFDDLYDESLSLYTLQLSCYQIPLEDIGLKVIGRRIIWLKDDGTYEKISLQDVTQKLRKTL